jgi:hypothetical protein
MLLSNGSWNVVVLYTHTFRDDEHLTHEMQIKGKYLVFSFLSISKRQERAKCLEQKKKMIRLEKTVVVDASHQLISCCWFQLSFFFIYDV